MTTITIQSSNKDFVESILAISKVFKAKITVSESEVHYDPEFVAKIQTSLTEPTHRIDIEDIWK